MSDIIGVILGAFFTCFFGVLVVAPYLDEIDTLRRKLREAIERERLLGEELKKYTALARERGME